MKINQSNPLKPQTRTTGQVIAWDNLEALFFW
jgi:hypothetical protein